MNAAQLYYTFTVRYSLRLIAVFYAWTLGLGVVGLLVSYTAPAHALYPRICFLGWALDNHEAYIRVFHWTCSGSGIVSVLLFGVILWAVRGNDRRVAAGGGQSRGTKATADAVQQRMTVSICMSSACTLVLLVVPTFVLNYMVSARLFMAYVPLVLATSNLNPIANFLIFTTRHRELRVGIKHLLQCKRTTELALEKSRSQLTGGKAKA